jgi:hypothetical protein
MRRLHPVRLTLATWMHPLKDGLAGVPRPSSVGMTTAARRWNILP